MLAAGEGGDVVAGALVEPDLGEGSGDEPAILGVGVPLAIALFFIVLGLVLMLVWRFGPGRAFFTRRGGEAVSDEVALAALGPTAPGA